jgi:putative DNA primase/helicase
MATSDGWKSALIKNRNGVVPCLSNLITIFGNEPKWRGVLAYDALAQRVVKKKTPPWHDDDRPLEEGTGHWVDEDAIRAASWAAREWECTPTSIMADQAVMVVARRQTFHPVRDWLDVAETRWDQKPRVDDWLIRLAGASDTPYTRAVCRMFLLGAVARIYEPGCKVDHTLVLEGKTGRGKSTLLRDLFGAEWFLETEMDLGSKDFFQALRGKWGVELSELDSISRGELSKIKAVLTKRIDTYRESFGRHTRDYPRQCVFAGTTEEDQYLKDDRGNRRFLPVATGIIKLGAVARERTQLWGEAAWRYRHGGADGRGEAWHLQDAALVKAFEDEQEQRRQVHPWESAIARYLHSSRFVERGVTTADVLEALKIPIRDQTRFEEMHVGGILKKLGWERVRLRVAGERAYLYKPVDPAAWCPARRSERTGKATTPKTVPFLVRRPKRPDQRGDR